MPKKGLFPLSIMLALSLSSCGASSANPHILKNGDLLLTSEITFDNAFRPATSSYMEEMINSNESFIFYLTSSECSHCTAFKDVIANYIKDTKNLVLKMDIISYDSDNKPTYSDDFRSFYEKYGDYFFTSNSISTPQVYVVKGENVATTVPSSRYENSGMFSRAMNDYVYSTNVYSFTSSASYEQFLLNHSASKSMSILIDRNNLDLMNTYHNQIEEIIKNSSCDVALIEINEENQESVFAKFSIDSLSQPLAVYISGEIRDEYSFTANADEGKAFLNQYI